MSLGHVFANTEVARTKPKGLQQIQDGIVLASKGIMTTTDQTHQIFKNSYIHNDTNKS